MTKKRKYDGEPFDENSPLGLLLLQKFALGGLSAIEVQKLAEAATASGAKAWDLGKLSQLGGCGSSPQNCYRDLCRTFFKGLVSPEAVDVSTLVLKMLGRKVSVFIKYLCCVFHCTLQ